MADKLIRLCEVQFNSDEKGQMLLRLGELEFIMLPSLDRSDEKPRIYNLYLRGPAREVPGLFTDTPMQLMATAHNILRKLACALPERS